jgi:hypothetical protein
MLAGETPLEMARRHVLVAERLLARQEALVTKIEALGMISELYLSYELLAALRRTFAVRRADLIRLEWREAGSPSSEGQPTASLMHRT